MTNLLSPLVLPDSNLIFLKTNAVLNILSKQGKCTCVHIVANLTDMTEIRGSPTSDKETEMTERHAVFIQYLD